MKEWSQYTTACACTMHLPAQTSVEPVLQCVNLECERLKFEVTKHCFYLCLYHHSLAAAGSNPGPSEGVMNQQPSEVAGQQAHALPQLYCQNNTVNILKLYLYLFVSCHLWNCLHR